MINLISASLIAALISLFSAQSNYIITGQVNDNTGKAVCGVRVCAFAADFDRAKPSVVVPCALSDERGQFTIVVNEASTYKVSYDYSARGFYPPSNAFFRQPSTPIPEVVLDDANVRAWVTISMLPKNGLLVGKSVDAKTGLPVESVEFKMCHAANPEICWQTSAKSASGTFTIPAAHVPFILRAKADGFDDWLSPNGEDKEAPITIPPETRAEVAVFLKRSATSAGKAVSDAEKQPGVHLAAPVQLSPADDTVFNEYPRLTKLEWSPVEGAVSYAVEVDYCAGGLRDRPGCVTPQPLRIRNNPPTSGIDATTYEFYFVGAQPGRWRVWAVDKEGREGFRSPWRRFVYLK
jgi:hypothetical protein